MAAQLALSRAEHKDLMAAQIIDMLVVELNEHASQFLKGDSRSEPIKDIFRDGINNITEVWKRRAEKVNITECPPPDAQPEQGELPVNASVS